MNQKLAKMIRRMADATYDVLKERLPAGSYLQHEKLGIIKNAPNSPRGVYLRLKGEPIVRSIARKELIAARQLRKLQKLSAQGGLL
jgi:hypothetical protein